MIHLIIYILSLGFYPQVNHHDVPVAEFELSELGHAIELKITLDTDDLIQYEKIKRADFSNKIFEKYLATHSQWLFDKNKAKLRVVSSVVAYGHINLTAQLLKTPKTYSTLTVHNKVLNDVPHHSNNIWIYLKGKKLGYRMHAKRTQIEVNF